MSGARAVAARFASELGRRDATLPAALERALDELESACGVDAVERHGRSVANRAVDLAARSPDLSAAFLEAVPGVLAHLPPGDVDSWASQAGAIDQGTRRSASLAARWLRECPELLGLVPLALSARIAAIAGRLAAAAQDAASTAVAQAVPVLRGLESAERERFVVLAETLTAAAWPDAVLAFERTPDLVAIVGPSERSRLLDLAAAVATRPGTFARFASAVEGLGAVAPDRHSELLDGALRLAAEHEDAAIEFLLSAPRLAAMLTPDQFRHWYDVGIGLLDDERYAPSIGAYFRLESSLAADTLTLLSPRVELVHVGETLRLYAQALTGRPVVVRSARTLVERGIGWSSGHTATTEGSAIYLPPHIDRFDDRDANTRAYKVCVTHQAGRIEFGSFAYGHGVAGKYLVSTVAQREASRNTSPDGAPLPQVAGEPAVPPMHRFYDLFEDRGLAAGLLAIVEDCRIDAYVGREYPGVRSARREVRDHEILRRPDVLGLGLRDVFSENLLRASLGRPDTVRWPEPFVPTMARGLALLGIVTGPGATVQDTAEVTGLLYDLAAGIVNVNAKTLVTKWITIEEEAIATALESPLPEPIDFPVVRALGSSTFQVPYAAPPAPDFRGDFKPELVQTITALRDLPSGPPRGDLVMTADQLRDLLASSPEIELVETDADDAGGDVDAIAGQLLVIDQPGEDAVVEAEEDSAVVEWSWYDEWDFRANDYRPEWCRVGERPAPSGDGEFYEETLKRQHALVIETRRQFEMMRPESFRRIRRLEDGHEIDFDQAIEFHADRRAGVGPIARFYSRRDKVERDVAVAFLLDLSGSTDDPVDDRGGATGAGGAGRSPARKRGKPTEGAKRVIDVEREAAVLLVEALEAIGDTYALYGFSGYGRQNVEFHVIKDLDEKADDRVRGRIGALSPRRSTRMGPAIRHATEKLHAREAKIKLLVLVSDGRPQDHGYGRDRDDTDYAVHDTRQALTEAKRNGVVPFLITVDSEGDDYLRDMCEDFGYEVVTDVESLPRRLPALYRHLAT